MVFTGQSIPCLGGRAVRNRRRKVGECAYCGETRPLTDDHVPPKNLFAPPRPPDLITVPSCNQCHDPMSKDDEYFRLALANRADVAEHPDAVGVWPALMRSLQRPEAPGLKRSFLGEVRKVESILQRASISASGSLTTLIRFGSTELQAELFGDCSITTPVVLCRRRTK